MGGGLLGLLSGQVVLLFSVLQSLLQSVNVVDDNNHNMTIIFYVLCSGPCTLPWYWLIVKLSM